MMKMIPCLTAGMLATSTAIAQWQPDLRLTDDVAFSSTTLNNGRNIASNGDTLHVTWFDERDGNKEIYYKRSTDAGLEWSADARLTSNPAISKFPSVAASGANVHVVWEEYRDGNAEIYYKRSPDAGATWEPDVRLTADSATSLSPSVAVSGSTVHVVWFDARHGNHEIFYKQSTDAGTTWGDDVRLTINPAASITSASPPATRLPATSTATAL